MNYISIDPVFLDLGFIKIYWYGMMYLLSFVVIYLIAIFRKNYLTLSDKKINDLIFYCFIAGIIGGRLGYLIFYNTLDFISEPLSFFYFQNGGMSFHGGIIGVILAMYIFALKNNKNIFEISDFIVTLAPIGIFFGRIGNYINAELWGKTTTSIFGVYGPDVNNNWEVRHPTQLYEAFLEGFVIFVILWVYTKKPRKIMSASAIFLILYGFFRFIIEFIRVPDIHIGYIAFGWLTMGQILSLPMIIIGTYIFYKAMKT